MEYTFKVTEEEANIILAGIQELPAKLANPLTKKLVEQAQAQQSPKDMSLELKSGAETKESFA